MDTHGEHKVIKRHGAGKNTKAPRRALIVTPSSTKAMDVSGGVAKVIIKHQNEIRQQSSQIVHFE